MSGLSNKPNLEQVKTFHDSVVKALGVIEDNAYPFPIDLSAISMDVKEESERYILTRTYDPNKDWKPKLTCEED